MTTRVRIRPGATDAIGQDESVSVADVALESVEIARPAVVRNPRPPRFTSQQVIAALRACAGIRAAAAKALDCSPSTIAGYIEREPLVRAAMAELRETLVDKAESVVLRHLQKGSLTAAVFILKSLGKHRGWNERVEVEPIGHRPPTLAMDWSQVPKEKLRELRQTLKEAGAYDRGAAEPQEP